MPGLEVRDRMVGECAVGCGPLAKPASGCRECGADRSRTVLADLRVERGDERPQRLDGVFRDRIDEGELQPDLLDRLHEPFGRRGVRVGHRQPKRFGKMGRDRLRAVPTRRAMDDPSRRQPRAQHKRRTYANSTSRGTQIADPLSTHEFVVCESPPAEQAPSAADPEHLLRFRRRVDPSACAPPP